MNNEMESSSNLWWQVLYDSPPKAGMARVTVGLSTCGRAAGGQAVYTELKGQLSPDKTQLVAVGCRGLCYAEPLVEVITADGISHLFGSVDQPQARLVGAWLQNDDMSALSQLSKHLITHDNTAHQERRVLSNCGIINPLSLEEYLVRGGCAALKAVLEQEKPEAVIDTVSAAGLRGRGGAGYPTAKKWAACNESTTKERYFIVNGDEGDPGAYMDRALLESDPHRVLEGLIIACYATGVHRAYIFIRAEYQLAIATFKRALQAAQQAKFLGNDILDSGFSLEVEIVRGAGAFLCGEGSAMVNVLENKPCTPRKKPPHLVEAGLWGKPTCINNVETLANVPLILEKGATWFRSVGTEKSPGTKIFSVVGSVARGGLIEVQMGSDVRSITENIVEAKMPQAIQIGGPSGVILPPSLFDLEVSFEGLDSVGGMIGSGGIVVIDETQCVVETASYLTAFSAEQSCKRCRVCRDGLKESAAILSNLTSGKATQEDIGKLHQWAQASKTQTLCGLGRTAFNPVISSLRFFADEFEAHITGRCPSLSCKDLIAYEIIEQRCQGERCCLLTCPGNAIKGRYGKPGHIVARLCQKCGMCMTSCPYSAVQKVSPP